MRRTWKLVKNFKNVYASLPRARPFFLAPINYSKREKIQQLTPLSRLTSRPHESGYSWKPYIFKVGIDFSSTRNQ